MIIMSLSDTTTMLGELAVLAGTVTPIIIQIKKIAKGTRCQLRSEMLRIYYHHKDSRKIRQFEYENFTYLYEAYKALKGNSFIDKIYGEVKTWEIIT